MQADDLPFPPLDTPAQALGRFKRLRDIAAHATRGDAQKMHESESEGFFLAWAYYRVNPKELGSDFMLRSAFKGMEEDIPFMHASFKAAAAIVTSTTGREQDFELTAQYDWLEHVANKIRGAMKSAEAVIESYGNLPYGNKQDLAAYIWGADGGYAKYKAAQGMPRAVPARRYGEFEIRKPIPKEMRELEGMMNGVITELGDVIETAAADLSRRPMARPLHTYFSLLEKA